MLRMMIVTMIAALFLAQAATAADWSDNGDGTYSATLTVTDGTRPASIFNSRALMLRQLVSDGYTVIDAQSSGGDGVNGAGEHGFTFGASGSGTIAVRTVPSSPYRTSRRWPTGSVSSTSPRFMLNLSLPELSPSATVIVPISTSSSESGSTSQTS